MPVILKKYYHSSLADVDAEIFARLRDGRVRSFIHVVPTKRKLRDAHRAYIHAVPQGIVPMPWLFTLEMLAGELYNLLGTPKQLVEGPTQAVLVNEAIQSVSASFTYFRLRRGSRLHKGTFQKIVNVVNKLKEQGVYSSLLHAELDAADTDEQAKLRDIQLIYDEYERKLGMQFIDPAGRSKQVNDEWDDSSSALSVKKRFDGVDTVFVSGFDEFSNPELTMLDHLSNVPGIAMVVSFDYHAGNDQIFGHLRENFEKLLDIGFIQERVARSTTQAFAEHIAANLFRYDSTAERLSCTMSVTLLDAEEREKEIELIAKLIKHLALERPDRDLSKVCVAIFQPQRYTNLIREVFARYGIPANVTDRYALDQSPFVVSLLSLLAVQQNDFRLTDLMRALSSPFFRFGDGGKQDVDAGNLYEVATRLKIVIGRSTWESRIDQRLRNLATELAEVDDETEEIRLQREEAMLRKAKQDLSRVTNVLAPFAGMITPLEFKHNVDELLKKLHTVECLVGVSRTLVGNEQLEKDVRAYQKFLNFLNDFLGILVLGQNGNAKEPLSFYTERLRAAIPQVRYNVRQQYGNGVQVTSFDETRGLSFDVMIIAGLVDGEFPPVYQPEIFFSNTRREKKERYHLTEHRYLFYQALTNFSEHLYITIPRCDDETPLVPSSFIDSLLNTVVLDDRRAALPPELTGPIYSEDELLQHIGAIAGRENTEVVERELAKYPDILEVLEHIRRAIMVEKSRIEGPETMPEYNGRIGRHVSAEARTVLDRFRHRIYSVTQLESYGCCPFQFFADKVLRLHVVPEARDGVSPLERGGVLHEVLFEFYSARRERGNTSLANCSDDEFLEAVHDLTTRARTKLDALAAFDIFWDVEKELILGARNRKGILEEFLQKERDSTLKVEPAYFEAAFGSKVGSKRKTDPHLSSEDPIAAGNVQLRGKIDRVDIGDGLFTIIDYKTGAKLAGRKEIDLGMSLQLPIYLFAVEQMLSTHHNRTVKAAAGVYYKLKSPVKPQLGIGSAEHRGTAFESSTRNTNLLPSDDELKQIVDQAITYVNTYVDSITRGEFPVEPKVPAEVCRYCDFQTICRIKSRVVDQPDEGNSAVDGDE
ncbi:MAG: exodeoxyribonuclease V subunit gamma [Ignavibacteriae bacterium]|nr:exodeoxyribonuclease V subunit gamma [Ignavibacteria bacterium]MBI3363894.1 exodeoxyribonuclease V subunit gamma [Ignavibacteriota bacterium]